MSCFRTHRVGDHSSALLTRRAFLRRSLTFSAGIAAASSLLAGCWPFSDDEADDTAEDDEDVDATPDESLTEADPAAQTPTPEPSPTAEPTPEPSPTPVEPQQGGTLAVALAAEPWSLHPDAAEATPNWYAISQIFDPLIEVDYNFELVQVLAENYEVAEDGASYTFTLPEGVLFHNGAELTSEDVRYTHAWAMDPENGAARSFYYERVAEVQAPDPRTVVFRMDQPDATFLRRAAGGYIVNAGVHEEFGAGRYSSEPVGTGPFRLDQWSRGTSLRLIAFEDYFGGRTFLDGIELRVVSSAADRAGAIENGDADVAFDLPLDASLSLAESDDVTTLETADLDINHIALNNEQPILADRNVRLAMLYAVDRRQLADDLYQGAATPATSYLSPAIEAWHEPMIEEGLRLVDRSVELLEESGWVEGGDGIREREGERLSFVCRIPPGDDPRRQTAERVRAMLAEVGVEMNLEEAPVNESLESLRAGEIDAAIFNWTYGGWRGEPDARTTLLTGAFNNYSNFSSAQLDHFLVTGVGMLNDEERHANYIRVQEIFADQVPFLFLLFEHSHYHFGPRVFGLPESALWGARLLLTTRDIWMVPD